jgi:hypothetical protein
MHHSLGGHVPLQSIGDIIGQPHAPHVPVTLWFTGIWTTHGTDSEPIGTANEL